MAQTKLGCFKIIIYFRCCFFIRKNYKIKLFTSLMLLCYNRYKIQYKKCLHKYVNP